MQINRSERPDRRSMRLTCEYRPSYGWLRRNRTPERAFCFIEQRGDRADLVVVNRDGPGLGFLRKRVELIHCAAEIAEAASRKRSIHARAVSCISWLWYWEMQAPACKLTPGPRGSAGDWEVGLDWGLADVGG